MEDKNSQLKTFKSLSEFYPFYLTQHQNSINQKLHFMGTIIGNLFFLKAILTLNPFIFLGGLIIGYGLAWIGHFFFEANKPATFQYPLYSFLCDYIMVYNLLLVYTGKKKKL